MCSAKELRHMKKYVWSCLRFFKLWAFVVLLLISHSFRVWWCASVRDATTRWAELEEWILALSPQRQLHMLPVLQTHLAHSWTGTVNFRLGEPVAIALSVSFRGCAMCNLWIKYRRNVFFCHLFSLTSPKAVLFRCLELNWHANLGELKTMIDHARSKPKWNYKDSFKETQLQTIFFEAADLVALSKSTGKNPPHILCFTGGIENDYFRRAGKFVFRFMQWSRCELWFNVWLWFSLRFFPNNRGKKSI